MTAWAAGALRSPLGQVHEKPDRHQEFLIEPLARLIRSVPGVDHTVELQDLRLEHPQLGAERGKARARNLGHPFVTRIGDDPEQFLNTIASDRRDDPVPARWPRIALITAVCWRMNRWRVRWSIRQLCCSGVLVSTNRMFAVVTASQMASASAASFFCRLT